MENQSVAAGLCRDAAVMTAAHERQKMAQAALRFCDALRAYVVAVYREHRSKRMRSLGPSDDAPSEGAPIQRSVGVALGILAFLFILKAAQS